MAKQKNAVAAAEPEASETATGKGVVQGVDAAPDVFDDAVAARQAEESTRQVQANREPGDGTEPEARNGITKRTYKKPVDPRGIHTIMLSEDPEGPKARLLRSNDHQAMLIQFSDKPDAEVIDALKEGGFRWEPRAASDFAKSSWIIDLEQGNEWRNHTHAEKVFQGVVNQIRAKNGMEPFVPGAAQSV